MEQKLLDLFEPLAKTNGVEIITVEVVGAKKAPVIRVYIDTNDGVSFQELSTAQAWIGDLLDEIDPFTGAYTLEVSSPGIDRPLRTVEHFKRAVGEDVRIKTQEAIDGRCNFKGVLTAADDDSVTVQVQAKSNDKAASVPATDIVHIPVDNIKKANVIGKIEF